MKRIMCVFLLLLLLLCSCAASQKENQKTVYAMGTVLELRAFGANAEKALSAAEAEIERLDNLLSRGFSNSDISKINKSGSAEASSDTRAVLRKGIEVSNETGGAFDLCIAPAVDLWGFYSKNYYVPSDSEIAEILPKINYKNITLTDERVTLSRGAQIDAGGIAKGYLSDRIIEIFKEHGVVSAIISLGGNVQTLGTKNSGEPWRVGIKNPAGGLLGTLDVCGKAVVTSGGYQRYFEDDGKKYHHIIDPETGKPAESGLKSVTVVSSDGALADALSTAVFVMGKERGENFWKERNDFDIVFMTDTDEIFITEGLKDSFQSGYNFYVISR